MLQYDALIRLLPIVVHKTRWK